MQRNLKVAQALARNAEKKKAEAMRLAIEFDTAKTAAREAGQVRLPFPHSSVAWPPVLTSSEVLQQRQGAASCGNLLGLALCLSGLLTTYFWAPHQTRIRR